VETLTEREVLKMHAELHQPNAEELSILKNQEPLVSFEIVKPFGFSEGRQSRVTLLEYTAAGTNKQVVWKRMGAGKGLTEAEAHLFESRLRPYRNGLHNFGWRVPQTRYSQVVEVGGEFQVFSYDQFIPGGDAEHLVLNPEEPNFLKWHLLREIVSQLASYPQSDIDRKTLFGADVSVLPHGLDLKLANIVSAENGVFFVDLFGPKELNEDRSWKTYSPKLDILPPENLLAVTGTREGAFLRLYRLIERHWSSIGGVTVGTLRNQLKQLLENSRLASSETNFILSEVQDDYPWLDRVYKEQNV